MKTINLKELKSLHNRYKTITMKEMEQARLKTLNKNNSYTLSSHSLVLAFKRYLTNFGNKQTCILCKKVKFNCDNCIYPIITGYHCVDGINETSYYSIDNAETVKTLHKAYRERAKHIKQIIIAAESNKKLL